MDAKTENVKKKVGKPPKPWIKQLIKSEISEVITVSEIEERYDIDKRSARQFFERHKIDFENLKDKKKNRYTNHYKLSDIREALEGIV